MILLILTVDNTLMSTVSRATVGVVSAWGSAPTPTQTLMSGGGHYKAVYGIPGGHKLRRCPALGHSGSRRGLEPRAALPSLLQGVVAIGPHV